MSNVEVIYIHRNKNSGADDLKPSVNLHKTKDSSPPRKPEHKPKYNYKPDKPKKRLKYYISIAIVFFILITAFSTAYNAGYVPIKHFLKTKEPSGFAREISYMQIKEEYPIVDSIPEIKSVKHKLYGTDDTISNVADKYKQDLSEEGFKLKYCGNTKVKGINIHYYGYIKGITAAVILMTCDDVGLANTETVVLYSTSNVFTYKSLIDKYSDSFDI